MSRYFPHSDYAEDQPLAGTILATHVATRGVTTGTIAALGVTSIRAAVPALRRAPAAAVTLPPAAQRVLLSASAGTGWGAAAVLAALALRMRGREDVEWRDRSWRLMENRGQLECDDWTYAGMGAGAALAAARRGGGQGVGVVRRALGGVGLGSVVGMVGYMAWRYGVNGGEFPPAEKKHERAAV